ncbi:MAG: hypothetical protein BroJett003_27900 [Planctomycetota bacterium]|nr:MAG: hypothetical protein BroJett003_27900 [Planctomycetota bacterium]
MSSRERLLAAGCVLGLIAGCQQGASRGVEQAPSPASLWRVADPNVAARLGRIEEEISREPAHAWAGRYVLSARPDSDRLILAPRSGYVLISGKAGSCCKDAESGPKCAPDCPGAREAVDGEIVMTGQGRIRLALELSPGHIILAGEFSPMTAGGQHYLISTEELDAFREAVRKGEEPRKGHEGGFLMRVP